jgi:hypothetical protein
MAQRSFQFGNEQFFRCVPPTAGEKGPFPDGNWFGVVGNASFKRDNFSLLIVNWDLGVKQESIDSAAGYSARAAAAINPALKRKMGG